MKKNNIFKIDLPKGWADQTAYVFQGPKEADIDHSIILTVDRKLRHDSIKSFADEKISPIVTGLDNIEVLKDEEVTMTDGNPAWEFVYKWIPAEGMIFFQKYIFVFYDDMGFTFTGKFTKQTIKTLGAQMKQIVDNLLPGTYEPVDDD